MAGNDKKVTVAIMTRNEQATIEEAVTGVMPHADETLVVDGHSQDRTRQIAESLGATVVLDDGHGKGDGIRKAIEVARGDILVFIDADLSHDPDDIPALVAPIAEGRSDLVVGSRWKGGSDELFGDMGKFIRSTGSSIITLSINYRWHVKLTDSQNGFRAISTEAARTIMMTEDIFTIEQEMIMKCLRRGFRISEVPTHEYQRRAGESQIVVWKVAYRYVWCLIKNLIK
ncbi:undecaprenyl-phosphate 4-deoxy-4-formamido-L-arabinose transferase [bacterium BMS3Abin01]|nr:undecaprenyl-phosphate 4-deoxy-4-formamido-L-arabinose transferase [bacterium BMS3Abin01]HDZ59664.1 glycosyltransferase family 2 protein [Actinomycetota bacterium]